jgi:uncharacterized protein (TIGR02145 family)
VVDSSNNVIYLTPMEGSAKAYLVSDPLPISFTVQKDNVTKVVPEVISATASTPEDFGYTTFSFDKTATFDFLIGVFAYNETVQNFEMTTAHLKITADSGWVYEKDVPAATDTISVKDNQSRYILTVTKDRYQTWTDTLTAAELKLYYKSTDKGPLIIRLQSESATVTDIDGNVYHTVKIGNQIWMIENLKVTKYNDGTSIPNVTDNTIWGGLTTPGYCWYNNDTSYKEPYGALYNWYAVNTGKLAPAGWHVPTDAEWLTLLSSEDGGTLKEIDFSHWNSPNTGATNSSGFTALPGGRRYWNFVFIGNNSYWWTTDSYNDDIAWSRMLFYDNISAPRNNNYKYEGCSVRCIKD